MSVKKISPAKSKVSWTHLNEPTTAEGKDFGEDFKLLDVDYNELYRPTFRTKIAHREDYIFLVIMVPVYMSEDESYSSFELDVVITKDRFATIGKGGLKAGKKLFEEITTLAEGITAASPGELLLNLVTQVFAYQYPLVDKVDEQLEDLEDEIFNGDKSRGVLVEEILQIRRTITDLRKAMRGHVTVLEHLTKGADSTSDSKLIENSAQFEALADDAKELWEALESNKEKVEALEDANDTMIAHNLNQVIKTLTVISTILLPAAVVAGIFGMNAKNTPIVGGPFDFWIMILIIFVITLGLAVIFWTKRWIR